MVNLWFWRGASCCEISLYTMCPTHYRTRLAGGPLLHVATIRHTTDTFLFISHTMNILLFKFCCNIFIGVRIIKEMPGSVASGTHCINNCLVYKFCTPVSSIQEWTTYFSWKPCNYCIFHYLYIWHEHLTWWWPECWRVKCVINSCMTDTVINNCVNKNQYLYA